MHSFAIWAAKSFQGFHIPYKAIMFLVSAKVL